MMAAIGETTRQGRYQAWVETGDLGFLADEPAAAGGDASGPNPFDLLDAALAACTAMTLKSYAKLKAIPLRGVRVAVSNSGGEFVRSIELDGELDPATRGRLLEIAERCPVHRTLTGGARIRTVAEPDPVVAAA
jgi:putative redox protein